MSPNKPANNQKNKTLTVVICSNRIKKIEKYTIPSMLKINSFCRILIVLDSQVKNTDIAPANKLNIYKNVSAVVCPQSGLSNLRNFAMDSCDTKFILFIDDDITIDCNSIKAIEDALNNGNDIVGLKLSPPDPNYVKRWFFTQNQYHYIGLHAISNNASIWGACMAFNLEIIKKEKLRFCSYLDRQNNKLLCGGDTTFIGELKNKGAKAKLLTGHMAIHYVDNARLNFFTFSRRVFWQGITESVRCNVRFGIIKELKRNFQIINIKSLLIGTMWFFVFLLGVGCGLFYKKIYIIQ